MSKKKTYFTKSDPKSKSLTRQSCADSSDINIIMDRVNKRLKVPVPTQNQPMYGDFSEIPNYTEMLNRTIEVKNYFMSLPAKTRSMFENNPQQLIDFVNNPNNLSEAIELGLLPPDVSKIKYINAEGQDVTDQVYEKRGFYVKGQRVDREGKPYKEKESVTTPAPGDSDGVT